MSVLAMVSICWLASQVASPAGSELRTYVDNFSWLGDTVACLQDCLHTAQAFCSALKLPIDWRKSFCWGSNHQLRRWFGTQAAASLPEGVRLQRVSHAKDLGTCFRYQRQASLAQGDARLAEGFRRLDVLARQPRPLANKARLIQMGVWPQCFFAQEGRALSLQKVAQFRGKAAKALSAAGHSQSSALTLSCVTPNVVDPEVYLMIQAAAALRRAFQVQPEVGNHVLQAAVAAQQAPCPVFGPASALAALLLRNSWEIHPCGRCSGPGCAEFNLRFSSRRQIRRAVLAGWAFELSNKVAHRNGLSQLGAIDFRATHKAVAGLAVPFHHVAANCISGGHMSHAAQSQWDPLVEANCRHCGAWDTKWHRCFQCPIADAVRQPFLPLLSWVADHAPHWIHASVATEHADAHVLRLINAKRVFVPPPNPPCDPYGGAWHFYTDGSCNVPCTPEARHASWAVVVDAAQTVPVEVLLHAFLHTHTALPAFHVVAQGMCPGQQSIGRAEICAILQVCCIARSHPHVICEVWSDSTYAIGFVQGLHKHCSTGLPDTDLDLCEWASVWVAPPNLRVHKVKSHQQLDWPINSSTRAALGNAVADTAAKSARASDLALVLDLVADVDRHHVQQKDMLRAYLHYQAELTKLFGRLRHNRVSDTNLTKQLDSQEGRDQWFSLGAFTLTQAISLPEDVPEALLLAAPWPPWFVAAVWRWTASLQWPTIRGRCQRTDGVTNIELLANFVATTSVLPPVHVSGRKAADVDPRSPMGILVPVVLKEAIMTLMAAIRFLNGRTQRPCFLGTRHHKIRALEVIGFTTPKRGFLPRPQMTHLGGTYALLQQALFGAHPGESFREACLMADVNLFPSDTALHLRWARAQTKPR